MRECHTCEACGGTGELTAFFPVYAKNVPPEKRKPTFVMQCPTCHGEGQITQARKQRIEQGKVLKQFRLDCGYGLRECAELLGMQPSLLAMAQQGEISLARINSVHMQLLQLPRRAKIEP